MAVCGPGCHPQNSTWTEAKLRSIYYFVGDRPVHKLPFGPKCHKLFVTLYSLLANLSDDMFFVIVYLRQKNEFGQNPEENIILTGPGQYMQILTDSLTKTNRDNIIVKYNIIVLMYGLFHIGPVTCPRY